LLQTPSVKPFSKYMDHPGITKIRSTLGNKSQEFSFSEVNSENIRKLVMSLESNKATSGIISPKLLKISYNVCSSQQASLFNVTGNRNLS